MSILDDVKGFVAEQREEYAKADSEDKMAMLVFAFIGGLIAITLAVIVLSFIWWMAKALFPFAVGAALFYVFGVFKWGWKLPRIKRK